MVRFKNMKNSNFGQVDKPFVQQTNVMDLKNRKAKGIMEVKFRLNFFKASNVAAFDAFCYDT